MSGSIRRILIIPGSADCNRGDQALVWTAIETLQDVYGKDVTIGLLSNDDDPEHSPQSRQTFSRGFSFYRLILRNPNRVLGGQSGMTHASLWNFVRVMWRSMLDFPWSLLVLLLARWPRLARAVVGRGGRATYDELARADLAVIKGGGFIYSYKTLSFYYYLWFVLFHIMLAQRIGVPVVILPNSFGPFDTQFSRWLSRRVLRRCVCVMTREVLSQRLVNSLLPGVPRQYPDMAFMLRVDDLTRQWARAELQQHGVDTDGKAIGITMRPWRFPDRPDPQQAYRLYVDSMAALIRHIRDLGLQPVLFAHVQGPGLHEMDRIALDDCVVLFNEGAKPVLIDGPYDCRQVKAMYGLLHAMVGTRFHSCIFSLSQAVPCLGIGYQGHKATGIMQEMGLGEYALHINDMAPETLTRAFDRLLRDRERIRQRCVAYMGQLDSRMARLRAELASVNRRKR